MQLITGQIIHCPKRTKEYEQDKFVKYVGNYRFDKIKVKPTETGWKLIMGSEAKHWLNVGLSIPTLEVRSRYFENKLKELQDAEEKS